MIQCLERHARSQGAIADHGHDAPAFTVLGRCDGHAQGGADRGARVSDAKGVVLAFRATGKRRQTAWLLDGGQALAPAGQHLVRIRLMSDVPDQAVLRGLENIMQGNRELDCSETGGEMSAARADAVDQELSQLGSQRGQARDRQAPQVRRRIEACKQRLVIGRAGHVTYYTLRRLAAGEAIPGPKPARLIACYSRSWRRAEACAVRRHAPHQPVA